MTPRGLKAPRARDQLCQDFHSTELLWSCSHPSSRLPSKSHPHHQAQEVLTKATQEFCKRWPADLEAYLDCDFLQQYLSFTSNDSEWLEEAFVTYIGGTKGSDYEWQVTNLVRSIQLFSSRPIVVAAFGDKYVAPRGWKTLPNVILMRFHSTSVPMSFNFNKIRSMILSRVLSGVQLDADQIIFRGADRLFEATRREINDKYPWPMLPVHWMSREDRPDNPMRVYAWNMYSGPWVMRWGHAHPTWSYYAVPFLTDLLLERYLGSAGGGNFPAWDLPKARSEGILQVLEGSKKSTRTVKYEQWMIEDEDMLNVNLWKDEANKDWCKFDLEPSLYTAGHHLQPNLYNDPVWYPDGIPIDFLTSHNTKAFEETDWLLRVLEACDNYGKGLQQLQCDTTAMDVCSFGSPTERQLRLKGEDFASKVCCCVKPRWETRIFWGGQWFKKSSEVPMESPLGAHKRRMCTLP